MSSAPTDRVAQRHTEARATKPRARSQTSRPQNRRIVAIKVHKKRPSVRAQTRATTTPSKGVCRLSVECVRISEREPVV